MKSPPTAEIERGLWRQGKDPANIQPYCRLCMRRRECDNWLLQHVPMMRCENFLFPCPKCGENVELRYDEASESWGYVCRQCKLILVVR